MSDNPYAPTDAPAPTPDAAMYLRQARPWLYFVAIVGLIGAAFMVVAGLAMVALPSLLPDDNPELGFMGPVFGLVYLVLAAVYAVPCVFMIQQATAIGRVATGGMDAVADVLRHYRNFWRVIGGMTLLLLVLYCGGLVAVTVAGLGAGVAAGFEASQ